MKILLYISIVGALFFGCKKYPEDEQFVHLKTPLGRIKQYNEWRITEYNVNGIDSIPHINSKVPSDYSLDKISFFFKNFGTGYIEFNGAGISNNINIKFAEKKRKISIGYQPLVSGYNYSLFLDGWNTWEIQKLEKGILIIEVNKSNKVYRIKFEKLAK